MDPSVARRTWRALEAVHGMIYFTPEAPVAYAAIGVTGNRRGYFGSRAAAMGPVTAEVVIATFFNFEPGLVRRNVPAVWRIATPQQLLDARLMAVDRSLRRAFGDEVLASADLAEAAELARRAALVAVEHPEGRPLFAAHAGLDWPDEDHLVLWHAQSLLREYRGDGHLAALTMEGLSGCEALVSHAASGEVSAGMLQASRGWSDKAWAAAVERMVDRDLVSAGTPLDLTHEGRAQRDRIEAATDRLALAPYAALGGDTCDRLRQLSKPLSRLVINAGLLHVDPTRWRDDP